MRFLTLIFYVVLMLFTVCFAALNAGRVTLNFYIQQIELPISVWMISAFILGIFLGVLLFLLRYLKLKKKFKKMNHQVTMMEKEIKNIRTMPLKD